MSTFSSRPQGWCPRCILHSVVLTSESLVCTSPQCEWEASRTSELEAEVFSGPPPLTPDRMNRLRAEFGLKPVS